MSTTQQPSSAHSLADATEQPNEKRAADEDDIVYVGHLKFSVVFISLCLSVFQVALDEVIVATALPTITDDFNSLNDVGWYGSAYLFTDCAFQLVFGKFYAITSIKYTYMIALIIFEVGSIICATAPSSVVFIIGRLIAGLGAGGILSGVLTILSNSVPRSKIAPFVGIVGAVNGTAFIAGPLIGGAIIGSTTWRWIFWMNPILSTPTFFVVGFMLRLKSAPKWVWKKNIQLLDLPSFAVFLGSITCLLLALQWGGSEYHWRNARVVVLFVTFGLSFALFMFMNARKRSRALVPMQIVTQRSIVFGIAFSFCTSGAGFILEYYLPIWLQAVKDFSVIASAVRLLPIIISAILFALGSGIVAPLVGYYVPFMYGATILLSLGMGLLSSLHYDTSMSKVLGYQVPAGMGLGLALQQTLLAAQTILPLDEVPIGISLITLAQTLGGTVALSAADTIFTSSLGSSIARAVPDITQDTVLKSGITSLREQIPAQYLPAVLNAYSDAVVKAWYLSLALACASIIGVVGMEWKRIGGPSKAKHAEGDAVHKPDEDIQN